MTKDQAKKCCLLVGRLFPNQLTKELAKLAGEKFLEWDVADVEKAVKQHRESGATEKGFIDWKGLFAACAAAGRSRSTTERISDREGTWCDVYRRQRPDLVGRPDLEVVLRIHRGWWAKCGGFETDESKRKPSDSYRRQIEHSCITQLIASGTKPDDAPRWAATIFEESVDYFRQVLEEVREAAAAPHQEALPV